MKIKDLKEWVLICLNGSIPVTLVSSNEKNDFTKHYDDVVDFEMDKKINDLEIDSKMFKPVQITTREIIIWLE